MSIRPATGVVPSTSPTSVPNTGRPQTKARVPSIGSITHEYPVLPLPGRAACSSPRMASSEKRASMAARNAVSAALSARVTGDASAFHSTVSLPRNQSRITGLLTADNPAKKSASSSLLSWLCVRSSPVSGMSEASRAIRDQLPLSAAISASLGSAAGASAC